MSQFMHKNISINPAILAGCLSSFWFAYLTFSALYNVGLEFSSNLIIFNIIFFALWPIAFFFSKKEKISLGELTAILVLLVVNILIYSESVYDNSYAMLNVYEVIQNKSVHRDILYHSTIAEAIKNYFTPSILQDGISYRGYHYLSHIIVAIFSKIISAPAIYIYNFVYPQLAISLFLFLTMRFCIILSKFTEQRYIYTKILIFLMLYNIFAPYGTFVVSQSFFISIALVLYFTCLFLEHDFENKICNNAPIFLITAVFIFIISLCKISTGFAFTGALLWYLFRKNTLNIKNLLSYGVLLSMFFCAYLLFKGVTSSMPVAIRLGMPPTEIWKYSIPAIILTFIISTRFKTFSELVHMIKNKSMLVEESFIIMFFFALLINFALASSGEIYFILPLSVASIFLMLSLPYVYNLLTNFLDVIWERCVVKIIFILILFFIVLNMNSFLHHYYTLKSERYTQAELTSNKKHSAFEKYFSINKKYTESTLFNIIDEINTISKNDKIDYGIFIDDSKFLNGYGKLSDVFMLSAFTGIVSYGNVYHNNEGIYTINGNFIEKKGNELYHGLKTINIKEKQNLPDILLQAKKDGKKFIFYIKNDKLNLIDLSTINL